MKWTRVGTSDYVVDKLLLIRIQNKQAMTKCPFNNWPTVGTEWIAPFEEDNLPGSLL